MSYYEGTGKEESDRREFIKTCVQAFAFVSFWFCAMVYGLAYLSHVDKTSREYYEAVRIEERIKDLESHVHRYYDGHIK